VNPPVFILAASEDNLKRMSQTKDSSLSAPKAQLVFVVEDDLIRKEIIELVLEDDSEQQVYDVINFGIYISSCQ
jgi:hypothetical protein